jgi:hypothetical protein
MSSIVSFFYNFLCSLLDGTHGFGDRSYHTCACVASFLSLFFERALSYVRQLSIQRTNNNPRHTELPYGLSLRTRRGLMRLERQWGWLFSQPIVVHPCSPCHPVSRFREEIARRCSITANKNSSYLPFIGRWRQSAALRYLCATLIWLPNSINFCSILEWWTTRNYTEIVFFFIIVTIFWFTKKSLTFERLIILLYEENTFDFFGLYKKIV